MPSTSEFGGPMRNLDKERQEKLRRRWGWLVLAILCIGAGFCFGYTACVLDWIHR